MRHLGYKDSVKYIAYGVLCLLVCVGVTIRKHKILVMLVMSLMYNVHLVCAYMNACYTRETASCKYDSIERVLDHVQGKDIKYMNYKSEELCYQ